ncbi:DUF6326 family protein [uncultured Tenacibaculum sp.]|uniref:DUF6326 family protein n=1 Tax=uncultured Tenacibaculum sp. TaxID=174713 RepID=UPI00210F6949|nr:DUF6326 family protein [uncultured Tenacibaculum sp.]
MFFCDVFSLMLSDYLQQILNGNVGEIIFTEKFLLTFALIMEIPMLMIILSKITFYKLNRLLNIIVGIMMLIIQIGSLAIGENSLHYIFFSTVEIITLIFYYLYCLELETYKTTKAFINESFCSFY